MAHQAHNIPWTLLSSNLKWAPAGSCNCGATNLRPRLRPNQGKELTYFANAFAKNIAEHSACERRKYPEKYDEPSATDVILDEDIVKKIIPTVRRWRSERESDYCCGGNACRPHEDGECQCPALPYEERRVSAFFRARVMNDCYKFFEVNKAGFFNLELVKTLILHGEMDPILRASAHPRVSLKDWWHDGECMCMDPDLGWDQLCEKALAAYMCLNVTYCFPEMWDVASGKTEETDYRHTKFYQHTLMMCTEVGITSDVVMYPHQQFFGAINHRLASVDENHRCGKFPFDKFLALMGSTEHQPNLSDVCLVRWMLCRKGLPVELSIEIMRFAEYVPKGTLKVPHDPFHPSNSEELALYLKYCWQILVRCDMMAKALDMKIPWQNLITKCIIELWGSKDCCLRKWYEWLGSGEYDTTRYEFL
ncbi:hypothetical protein L228DRAFT_251694 [Xylona heveae TC161]|uniref:Uncharacterized protein n=1 Tax=Xylona heveae (strain CBS 132557 / TC161) TaxID=1328760 RepID=A0A164Z9A7_XYLHT|nr:hypothetical protein L228DRAFT_251694 [Xylona heveae TC161]KZF18840.1 hypothetical protein L228DRAFT_251694 [Xylona heveae TC161]